MLPALDCTRCGACCTSPEENRREGFRAYVTVTEEEALLRRKDLVGRYVARGEDGRAHLRLTADHRCLGLLGAVGRRVRCALYHHRPAPCRRVNPGDAECLNARRERGL
ncbi:MAG: YkgJ family cysteine cluster protein [Deltaproteobacteria bacterium]|nr:YkgJ family cysteine cluster protein [Deltaproteobacteria bacterium]